MAPKELKLSRPPSTTDASLPIDAAAAHLGRICELRKDGTLTVSHHGAGSPVPARLAVSATRERIETAILLQQTAVLLFEQGDPQKPIVIGFLSSVIDEQNAAESPPARIIEADVDGKRVSVTGQDEIVLQCGQASITLRRNGRVMIRGTHVETCSEGTNRIKGGQVRIN